MRKIVLPIALAAATLCVSTSVFAEYSFKDIEDERYEWCASQIQEMYEAGYIKGYEDGTYRPDTEVNKLECISIFSRAMGATDESNERVLKLAHDEADEILEPLNLDWGQDELAYMMYKGALTESDITTYISGATRAKPMTRGEAAVIITKAMGGEDTATEVNGIDLHYKDKSDIPSNILQYVKYVTDEGIMNGIDDAFCADKTVTRSQIAVMLQRVTQKCDYSFAKARINSVDTESSIINYTIDGEEEASFEYTDDTLLCVKGVETHAEDIPENVEALIQFSAGEIILIDAMSDQPDQQITAVFAGYNMSSTTMKISVKDSESSQTIRNYTCDLNVPITYAGSPASIKSLKAGDAIEIFVSDGIVRAIKAVEKITEIKGATVAALDFDGVDATMTIATADSQYDGNTYPISDSVKVTKNNSESDLNSVFEGDSVTITIKYGEITQIKASAVSSTHEGVLKSITIGESSSIVMNINGKEKVYQIPVSCVIEKGGEEADIYSLRLNDTLKITVESGAVTKIKSIASNTTVAGKVSGTVTAVNTGYKFIAVLADGETVPLNVYTNATTKYTVVRGSSGTASLKTVDVGDKVECYVTSSNGAYIASDVVIEKAEK